MGRKKRIICFCVIFVMLWANITFAMAKTPKCPDDIYHLNKDRTISITADDVPAYTTAAGTEPKYKVRIDDVLKIGIHVEENILNKKKYDIDIARDAMKITVSNPNVLKIKDINIPQNTFARKQVVLEAIGIGDCKLNIRIPKTSVSRKASFTIPIHVGIKAPELISAKTNKKGQVSLEWKKSPGAKFYEVECSYKKSDLSAWDDYSPAYRMKKLKRGTCSAAFKKLKSGKTYYIRVSACNYDVRNKNGKLEYSVGCIVQGKIWKVKVK